MKLLNKMSIYLCFGQLCYEEHVTYLTHASQHKTLQFIMVQVYELLDNCL